MQTQVLPSIAFLLVLNLLPPCPLQASEPFDKAMQAIDQAAATRNLSAALEEVRTALRLVDIPEERFELHAIEAALCVTLRRNNEVLWACRNALAVEGVEPDRRFGVYTMLAMALDEAGRSGELRTIYAQALEEDLSPPVRCAALIGFARACESEGDHAAALQAYAEVLKAGGAAHGCCGIVAHTEIGDIYVKQEKYDAALEHYTKALLLPDPAPIDTVSVCCGVGDALIGLGRYAEARQVVLICANSEGFPSMLRQRPLSLVAESLRAEGRAEEAERAEQRFFELDLSPDVEWPQIVKAQADCRAGSLLAIGRFRREKGDREAALALFEGILSEESTSPQYTCDANLELAELADDVDVKLTAFQRVVDTPDAPPERVSKALLAMGELHLDRDDREKAREAFSRLAAMEDAPAEDREKARAHLETMD